MIFCEYVNDAVAKYISDAGLLIAALKGYQVGEIRGALIANGSGPDYSFSLQTLSADGSRNREYIGKSGEKKVNDMVLSRYAKEYLEEIEEVVKALSLVEEKLKYADAQMIYDKLPSAYKKAISLKEIEERIEEKVKAEQRKKLGKRMSRNGREFSNPANIASTGEKVRSKSEIIIHNELENSGLEYYYEKGVVLLDDRGVKVTRYPDFTVVAGGQTFYWEHFGKLDSEKYLDDLKERISLYHRNNICIGENLIITSDRPNSTVNAVIVKSYVETLKGFELKYKIGR